MVNCMSGILLGANRSKVTLRIGTCKCSDLDERERISNIYVILVCAAHCTYRPVVFGRAIDRNGRRHFPTDPERGAHFVRQQTTKWCTFSLT